VIPQTSPAAGYAEYKEQIDAAIARVMNSGCYILGSEVESFETSFASYVGVKSGIGVASGTDAIEIALRACDIGPGDVVFTVSHTAVATVVGIERTGASVALVDIDPATYNLSPECLAQSIRTVAESNHGRPAAIVPVHLYGHVACMPEIVDLANRHDMTVVEDCAQAHGAMLNGRRAGSWGKAAAFSFYPTKNLPAFGDGGIVVTDDASVAERARQLREYGWRDRFTSVVTGMNSRLDELQAAILNTRLQTLDHDNHRRRQIAAAYDTGFANSSIVIPQGIEQHEHVYHQYVVRIDSRDAVRDYLNQLGIGTAIHYPAAIHQQPAYTNRFVGWDRLAVTEEATRSILSLPMYPQLTNEQVSQISQALLAWNAG